jgi:D12 class N6 adenine-specific DNA methyltransferase
VSLKAPFPWFGGKSRVSDLVWSRLGDVPNYVEPFFGSGAVLLGRESEPGTETINDLDCMVETGSAFTGEAECHLCRRITPNIRWLLTISRPKFAIPVDNYDFDEGESA